MTDNDLSNPFDQFDQTDPEAMPGTPEAKEQKDLAPLPPGKIAAPLDADPTIAGVQAQKHIETNIARDDARYDSAASVFGHGGTGADPGVWGGDGRLSPEQQQQWIKDERAAGAAQESFWGGVKQYVTTPLKSIEDAFNAASPYGGQNPSILPGGEQIDTGQTGSIGDWANRKADERIALGKRRQFLADQMDQGLTEAATLTASKAYSQEVAKGIGDTGLGNIAAGIGRGDEYATDALFGAIDKPKDDASYYADIANDMIQTGKNGAGAPEIMGRLYGTTLQHFGRWIAAKTREYFPGDPARQYEFGTQLANGAGSMVAFMGPSMTASMLMRSSPEALGALASYGDIDAMTALAQTQADRGALAVAGGLGAPMQAESVAEDAEDAMKRGVKKADGTPVDENDVRSAFLWNLPVGATEALPLEHLMAPWASSPIKSTVVQMLQEGGQEWGQQVLENLAAAHYYDPDRKWDDSAWESGAVGAILGAGTEVTTHAAEKGSEHAQRAQEAWTKGREAKLRAKGVVNDVEPIAAGPEEAPAASPAGKVAAPAAVQPEDGSPAPEPLKPALAWPEEEGGPRPANDDELEAMAGMTQGQPEDQGSPEPFDPESDPELADFRDLIGTSVPSADETGTPDYVERLHAALEPEPAKQVAKTEAISDSGTQAEPKETQETQTVAEPGTAAEVADKEPATELAKAEPVAPVEERLAGLSAKQLQAVYQDVTGEKPKFGASKAKLVDHLARHVAEADYNATSRTIAAHALPIGNAFSAATEDKVGEAGRAARGSAERAIHAAIDRAAQAPAAAAGSNAKQAPAAARQGDAAVATQDMHDRFRDILRGDTPSKKWAKDLGASPEQMKQLVKAGVRQGLLRKGRSGTVRRTPEAKAAPSPAELARKTEAAQKAAVGSPQDLKAREAKAREFMTSPEWLGSTMSGGADTSQVPGFMSPEWKKNRVYNVVGEDNKPTGETIHGYDAAVAHLAAKLEAKVPGGLKLEKQAIIVIGFPGAGKGTVSAEISKYKGAAHITCDDAKYLIPEYDNGGNSGGVHDESSYMAADVVGTFMDRDANFIYEKVGSSDTSIVGPLTKLREQGFHTNLVYVDVPKAVAMERAISRFKRMGRGTSANYYDALKVGDLYSILKKEGAADETAKVDWNEREPKGWRLVESGPSLAGLTVADRAPGKPSTGTVGQPGVGEPSRGSGARSDVDEAGQGSLSVSPDVRVDRLIRQREEAGHPFPDFLYDYATRLEAARGDAAAFMPTLAEVRADKRVTKPLALELAHVVGISATKATSKTAALASIEDRHNALARAGEIADARRSIVGEGTGDLSEAGLPGDVRQDEDGRNAEGTLPAGGGERPGDVRRLGSEGDARSGPAEGLSGAGGETRSYSGTGAGTGQPRVHSYPAVDKAQIAADIAEEKAEIETARQDRAARNYQITDADKIGQGGAKAKVRANIEAIRTLKTIEDENRPATDAEKKILVKYTGWGAFSQPMFADHNVDFAKERAQMKSLLTPEEYRSAQASVLNAHFTSPEVIRGMWQALEHLGFKGGRVLEPAAGIGHFIGLQPEALRGDSAWTAVELDKISGGITKALYGAADVRVGGFEAQVWPNDHFDLAISNVPFDKTGPYDPAYKQQFSLHDYFFVKALDKVRPGGIVAFVTSHFTLDKQRDAARLEMEKRGSFLGAIRLPGGNKGAFKANAGTDVTTDIIFFRKKMQGEPAMNPEWRSLEEVKTPEGPTEINGYFAEHPDMMLGKMRLISTQYAKGEPVLIGPSENIESDIKEAADKLPADAMVDRGTMVAPIDEVDTDVGNGIKEGAFYDKGGKIFRKIVGVGVAQKLSKGDEARVRGFLPMRDTLNDILTKQAAGEAGGMDALRAKLNAAYDAFVKEFGPINQAIVKTATRKDGKIITTKRLPNFAPVRDDQDAYKVAAIENYDAKTGKATKAAIFTEDIVAPYERPDIAGPSDALAVSLNETGKVDIKLIAQMLGTSEKRAIETMGDGIFLSPNGEQWQTAGQYLSGDVVTKLEQAKAAAALDHARYDRNVAALEAVQPIPLTRNEITLPFGASYLPEDIINDFLNDTLETRNAKVSLNPATFGWSVRSLGNYNPAMQATWGTNRVDVENIVEAALNSKPITIYDKDGDEKVRNLEAEALAMAKVTQLKEAFTGQIYPGAPAAIGGWVWDGDARAERLESIYNQAMNRLVKETHDGSHLTFPGLARVVTAADGSTFKIDLGKARTGAIWRIVQNGNTLIDHVVGAGKTWTSIMAVQEMKRLGQIRRPMFVVPNHMLMQFSSEFLQAYPAAKLLVATKDNMSRERRAEFAAKAAAEKWDGIIITHDAFGRLKMQDQAYKDYYEDALAEMEAAKKGEDDTTIKDIEKAKKRITTKLDKLTKKERKDQGITFEELGVDHLTVDEAHLFKNLWFMTRHTRIKGISNSSESQRATDLFIKIQHLEKARPGRSALFLTGTPLSNTMAEVYTMMRYLQNDTLQQYGISNFDSWAQTFGIISSSTRLAPNGRDYRDETRFNKFVNIPELSALYGRIADTQTAESLGLKRPTIKGGVPKVIASTLSDQEESLIQSIIEKMEELKGAKPEKGQPNFLSMFTKGLQASTDARLVDPTAPFNPNGKIAKAVDNIARIYEEGNADPAAPNKAQIVFLDMGVPGSRAKAKPFNVNVADEDDASPSALEKLYRGLADVEDAKIDAANEDGDAAEMQPEVDEDDAEAEKMLAGKFNLYEDIKNRLIEKGVPAHEIAFIHDAKTDDQKAKLFEAVREGTVRVLIGSTGKMGVGTNVQKRLIALHHIDAPWKPADLEQRDGRIQRQGNKNDEVEIYRYISKRSFEAYRWQILEDKANFIAQFRAGARGLRIAEDIDSPVPDAGEIKAAATGDRRIVEHAELDRTVRGLMAQASAHGSIAPRARQSLASIQRDLEKQRKWLDIYRQDAAHVEDLKGDNFKAEVYLPNGQTRDLSERKEAGEALRKYILTLAGNAYYGRDIDVEFGRISGFEMAGTVRKGPDGIEFTPSLTGETKYDNQGAFFVQSDTNPNALIGAYTRLLAKIPSYLARVQTSVEESERQIPSLEAKVKPTPFPKQAELEEKQKRLSELTQQLKPKEPKPAAAPVEDANAGSSAKPDIPGLPVISGPDEGGGIGQMGAILGYHGSGAVFDRFSNEKVGSAIDSQRKDKTGLFGTGHYVSTSKAKGALYSDANAKTTGAGHLYQVSIDAEPDQFLNWHMPLGKQGDLGLKVAKAIAARGVMPLEKAYNIRRGEDVLQALGQNTDGRHFKTVASEQLAKLGVAGIAYVDSIDDNQSRHWDFVVFDPNKIKITHRDGSPVTAEERAMQMAALVGGRTQDASQEQRRPAVLTPRAQKAAPEIAAAIEDELRQALPRDVAGRAADALFFHGSEATGLTDFSRRLVEVSLNYGEGVARETARHEIVHVLRGNPGGSVMRSLYTDGEWQMLVDRATKTLAGRDVRAEGEWALPFYREAYSAGGRRDEATVREALDQERVAKMAETWADGATYGTAIDKLLYRIKEFIDAIARALRALGFNTPTDIFGTETDRIMRDSFSGDIANRSNAQPQLTSQYGGSEQKAAALWRQSAAALRDQPLEQQIADPAMPGEDMGDDARRARAEAMGFDFDTPYYHGTGADFDSFQTAFLGKNFGTDQGVGTGQGFFFTTSKPLADKFANTVGGKTGHVLDVRLKMQKPFVLNVPDAMKREIEKVFRQQGAIAGSLHKFALAISDKLSLYEPEFDRIADAAMRGGYDSVVIDFGPKSPYGKFAIIPDPTQIRDHRAAFNPEKSASAYLMASIIGERGGKDAQQIADDMSAQGARPEQIQNATNDYLRENGHDEINFDEMAPKLEGANPTTQVRTPTKSQPVQALSAIIEDLKAALGMTATQGRYGLSVSDRTSGPQQNRPEKTWRFRPQEALRGQYHTRVGAARYRLSTDIDAIAHEGGHHLETMLGAPLLQLKRAHADELRSYAYRSFTPAAQNAAAPNLQPGQGYAGVNLDSEAQRLLVEAVAADSNAVSAGTPAAKAQDQRLRAELEYRLGQNTADTVFMDAYKHAQAQRSLADLPQYVQSRFSETGVPVQPATDARASLSEGFAEFFREYLLHPDQARRFAPQFYADFEDLLDARAPQLLQKIERAQLVTTSKRYDDYLKSTTLDRARADLKSEADQSWYGRVKDTAVMKAIGQADTISGAAYRIFSDAMGNLYGAASQAYRMFVDEAHPFYIGTKRLLEQSDQNQITDASGRAVSLAVHENPYKLMRSIGDSFKTGLRWIQDGMPNYRESGGQRSASLHDALALVMGKKWNIAAYQDFGVYLESRRAAEEWKAWNQKRGAMATLAGRAQAAAAQNGALRKELAKEQAKAERRTRAGTGTDAVMKEYDRVMQELVTRETNIVRELQEGQVATPGMTPQQERSARLRLADARQKINAYDERRQDFVVRRQRILNDSQKLDARIGVLNSAIAKRDAIVTRSRAELEHLRSGGIQRDPHRIGLAEHEARIAELQKLYPALPQAAQMVYDFVWQSAVHDFQAGRLTKPELDYRATRRHFYVPFARDLSDAIDQRGGLTGKKQVHKFAKDKTFEGSDRAIVNPIETIIDQTFHRAAATHFNDVMKTFVALADSVGPGGAAIAERVEQSQIVAADKNGFKALENRLVSLGYAPDDAKEMVKRIESDFGDTQLLLQWSPEGNGPNKPLMIPLWENGERKLIRLNDPEWAGLVYNSVNGMGRELSNLLMDALSKPAALLRWSVTTNPAFIIPNIIRDMASAWILTGNVLDPRTWPLVTQMRGIYHELAQTDMARLYQEVGGLMGGQNVAALSKVRDQADVMALKTRGIHMHPMRIGVSSAIGAAAGFATLGPAGAPFGALLGAGFSNGAKNFFETNSHFADLSETATRLGVFTHAYKAALSYNPSLTPYQAAQEAAYVARDLIDFGRRGSNMLVAARLVPFLNANVQGLDKAVRTLLGRSDRGFSIGPAKITAAGGAGALAGYLAGGAALGAAGAFAVPAAAVALATRSEAARRLLAPAAKRISGLPLSADEERIMGESAKAWTNLLLYTGLLVAMGAASGGGDPDEYKMISQRVKNKAIPVKLGGDWYQIPKAFEFSVPANIIEAGINLQFDKDPRFWDVVRSNLADNIAPPGLPQSAKLWSDIRSNYNSLTGGEIVPDWQRKSLPPQEQFNAYTSGVAIAISRAVNANPALKATAETIGQGVFGPNFEVSPYIIDYALSTGGGYWGKDIQKLSNADRATGPQSGRVAEYPIIGTVLQRLSIDPNRANDALQTYYDMMAPTGQGYDRAAGGYDFVLQNRGQGPANALLATMDDDHRAYALVMESSDQAAKRSHPLNRLKDVLGSVRSVEQDLALGRLADTSSKMDPQPITLSPSVTAEVRDTLAKIKAIEAWNTMTTMHTEQFANRQPIDIKPTMDLLRAESPQTADELQLRYDRKHVMDFDESNDVWKETRDELLETWAANAPTNDPMPNPKKRRAAALPPMMRLGGPVPPPAAAPVASGQPMNPAESGQPLDTSVPPPAQETPAIAAPPLPPPSNSAKSGQTDWSQKLM